MSTSQDRVAAQVSLAVEGLRRSGCLRLQVRGESMLPTLGPGDVVEIAATELDTVHAGQIVLALRDDRLFLHRFVGRTTAGGFLARGDSMLHADPAYDSGAFLGRVVRVVGNGLPVSTPLDSRPWDRLLGLLCCYNGLARCLTLKLGWRRGSAAPAALPDAAEV